MRGSWPRRHWCRGSSVFRKRDGNTVNVTRVSPARNGEGSYRSDECCLDEANRAEDGGCVRPNRLTPSATG